MRFKGLSFLFFIVCYTFFVSQVSAQIIHSVDFENWSDNRKYTKTDLRSDGLDPNSGKGFDDNRAFIDDDMPNATSGSSKALKISYPANNFGTNGTGVNSRLRFSGRSEAFSSYRMRFDENFDWGGTSEGGKLPGLASEGNCSGCETCTGTNGMTARLMWRSGGRGVLYLYHMDKPGNCGEDINLKKPDGSTFFFEKGVWYKISQRVKINTGSSNNGEVEVWINDELALLKTGIKFVTNGSKVDNLYFSTFHGGGSANWAPSRDSYIWYDDVMVAKSKADVVNTVAVNAPPTGSFSLPSANVVEEGYASMEVRVEPADDSGIRDVVLKIDGSTIRREVNPPYQWGHTEEFRDETRLLGAGSHVLEAVITDDQGLSTTITKTITVNPMVGLQDEFGSRVDLFPNPSKTGIYHLSKEVSYQVFELSGSMLVESRGQQINLSSYSVGVYILKVGSSFVRLVK